MRTVKVLIAASFSVWQFTTVVFSAEFFVLPGSKSLLMMGETVVGDFEEFQNFTSGGDIETIILRGPGGSLGEAFSIAQEIQNRGLNTVVAAKSECASACSLMFIGGVVRTMEKDSALGFHLPFLALQRGEQQEKELEKYCEAIAMSDETLTEETASIKRYFNKEYGLWRVTCLEDTYRLGFQHLSLFSKIMRVSEVSDEVFDIMISTPSDEMSWYRADEARELNLVNN